jgi:hypothetical protein
MNRAERRRRNKIVYDRRVKLYYHIWRSALVPCDKEETPVHNKYYCSKKAESWKEFQEKNKSMHLYKNTGTIWDHGYWSKYERHRLNKQSRMNAKKDLRTGEEIIYEKTNLK